jgi:hypothetical protein
MGHYELYQPARNVSPTGADYRIGEAQLETWYLISIVYKVFPEID